MKTGKLIALLFCMALAFGIVSGCASAQAVSESAAFSGDEIPILLSDAGSSCEDESVLIEGSTVTITAAGSYVLSGSLSDGQLLIDAGKDAKVKVILNGVTLIKNGGPAVYAVSADKLVLASAAGSENLLQSTGTFDESDKADAAVYAKCDLTFSGDGVLNISSLTGHAVHSKDDLKLKSGEVNLEAALKGFYGKDSVTIEGGTLNADVGTDAVCADSDDRDKGTITVSSGVLNLLAQKDGLDASGNIDVNGGILNISAGSNQEGKGLVSSGSIDLSGGTLNISAVDDAVHASGDVTLSGATISLSTGDDGIHADATLTVSGGELTVLQSYEGLEAQVINISGGTLRINARDDGLNAAGGSDSSNSQGFFGGDPFASDADAALRISGGTLYVNAEGDGLDSNGSLTVTGGEVYVSGPTRGGNGALDFGLEATITGGTVIAVGTADMAENFGQNSTQGSILLNLNSTQAAGSVVSVCDEKGNILAYFEPEKSYNSVVISTGGLTDGGSYTVIAGTETWDTTLDGLIYGQGGMMGGFGRGGMMAPNGEMSGFGNGQTPPDGQFPGFGRGQRHG